ncbi:MAG: trypsin-like peptidase domain-containing protein [Planctomycetes bacterium]|nr:trypsin-like peptidase domain-containing protein [Planctomycetota bacterium]MBU4400516.1 trypsin-like peptidase domain-containing protein [Planctomycetota bacterium]MCG2683907.1 trypsin-like peptidase domain-containing protein [Planctomycetales bacterium]
MLIHSSRIGAKSLAILTCAALGLVCLSTARAQVAVDLSELIKEVKPSVALIETFDKGKKMGSGSGFVVSEDGMIATNYHVIEGAKEIKVSFPALKDNKFYKSTGFVGFVKTKDLALIMIDLKGEKLKPLPMAKEPPSQAETVVAIGAPLGLSDTVTSGIVSAVRTGKELRKMLMRGKQDGYGEGLGYDEEATWIQTSAPISPGNSGGPLINTRGEVVGINTFVSDLGQNLNFSICIQHMKKFIDGAGKNVQSFANLPPPREKRSQGALGDAKKTLELWKNISRAMNELDEDIEACEKQFQKLPPVDPRNPMKGQNIRNRIISRHFKRMGEAYSDYANKISGFENKETDPGLISLVVTDTVVAKKMSESCKEVSNSTSSRLGGLDWELALNGLKRLSSNIDTQRELLRVNLGLKYDESFPTQAETAEEDEKLAKEKKNSTSTSEKKERSEMRVWTDSTGKFRIKAKCIGVEDGKVKLEKSDGSVLRVPLEKLSEADKRFLASTE